MDFSALVDPLSAAVVIGGTALATLLRAGLGECRATIATVLTIVVVIVSIVFIRVQTSLERTERAGL